MTSDATGPHASRRTLLGITCGMGAGALWGLVFLAPALAHDFSPIQLTIGRYVFYGLFSAAIMAPRWRRTVAQATRSDWLALGWLGLCGNILYYILLSGAVQLGGIAMTSLVIGFLPVAVTLVGSRDHGAVPLVRLWPSLLLSVAGVLCIGWQAVAAPAAGSTGRQLLGLACAGGALLSWVVFAVGNSRALNRLDHIGAHDWNLLMGIVTGSLSLLLIPWSLAFDGEPHAMLDWARLAGVSMGVALLASILGNLLWNRMSRLLPLTLVGQMILFETLFALLYGFLWEARLPTGLEAAAFVLVVASVLSCIAAHREPAAPEAIQPA